MPNATMYRDRARRLRVMAHEASGDIHRELLEISEQYERLADQAEMLSRTPGWPAAPAPDTTSSTATTAANRDPAPDRKDKRANR